MLPAALREDGVQVGRRDVDVDPVEQFAQGEGDLVALGVRHDGEHRGHEGVDVQRQAAALDHVDGAEDEVGAVDLVERYGVVTQVGLQLGETCLVVDGQRQLRRLVGSRLDEQVAVGAFEVGGQSRAHAGVGHSGLLERGVVYLLSISLTEVGERHQAYCLIFIL